MGQGPLHDAATQGPRRVPMTTAMGLLMGGTTTTGKEQPRLHQPGITNLPGQIPPWSLAKGIVPPRSHLVLN